jgi:hypothetical protein
MRRGVIGLGDLQVAFHGLQIRVAQQSLKRENIAAIPEEIDGERVATMPSSA